MRHVMKLRLIMALAAALGAVGTWRVQAHEDLLARIATITAQLSTNENNMDALLQRADLYRLHGNWAASRTDYAAVQKLRPDSADRLFGWAQVNADAGDYPTARAAYDEFSSRFPTNGPAFIGRARVLTQLGERKAAITDYSRGLALLTNPQPEEFLARASLQATEFGPDEAIKGLDEGLARLGWVVTFQRVAIDYELKRQRPDLALARLETILARANRKEMWLAWKGELLQAAGKAAEAQEALAAAIKAIEALPPRMRTSPGMVELRAKVDRLMAPPRGDQSAGKTQTTTP